jgi:tripartite-type tricarboxylate transporter receptor subunit TctC
MPGKRPGMTKREAFCPNLAPNVAPQWLEKTRQNPHGTRYRLFNQNLGRNAAMNRLRLLVLPSAALALLALASGPALALDYPTRTVRVVVPYPAGGTTDIMARLVANYLSEKIGQTFVVENKPGGGTNIGTQEVINAAPDGYTLLIPSPANAINATLYKQLPFDYLRDTVQIAGIARVPNVMEVNPEVPAKTVQEFIDYAKKNPGKLNMASSGNGSSIHLSGELFKAMTGVDMVHVPYKGSAPAITDLAGGQVQVMFDNLPSSISFIKAGRLRPLGVTSLERVPALPDVPPVAETVPGFEASSWFGVAAPKGTPNEIVEKLNKEVNAAIADPTIKKRIEDLGGIPFPVSAADFGKFVRAETDKWRPVVIQSGATVD